MPKPEPVVVSTVCSECGMKWEDHGPKPTLADCVRLLKARPLPQMVSWPSNVTPIGASASSYTLSAESGDDPPDDAVPAAV